MKLTTTFLNEFSRYFGLTLYGMDILISEKTGYVYPIDVNYFSSFDGFKKKNLKKVIRYTIFKLYIEFKEN